MAATIVDGNSLLYSLLYLPLIAVILRVFDQLTSEGFERLIDCGF